MAKPSVKKSVRPSPRTTPRPKSPGNRSFIPEDRPLPKKPIRTKDGKQTPKYKPGQKGTNSHYEAWKKANKGKPPKKREVSKKRAPGADAAVQALVDKAAKKRKKGDKIVANHEKRMRNDPKYKADFEEKKKKRPPRVKQQNRTYSNVSKSKSADAKPSSTTKPKRNVKPTPKAKPEPKRIQTSFIKKRGGLSKARPAASKKTQRRGLKFS